MNNVIPLRPQAPNSPWITPAEAADYIGFHVVTVRKMVRDGRIPAVRMSGSKHAKIRINLHELDAAIQAGFPYPAPARKRG